jgi:hypothetical protein
VFVIFAGITFANQRQLVVKCVRSMGEPEFFVILMLVIVAGIIYLLFPKK